jgi:hypothetical protein
MPKAESTEEQSSGGETTLWCTVILQAIDDARKPLPRGETAAAARRAKEITDARAWLTIPNRDFAAVCAAAGMDADAVREWARKILESRS